MRNPIFTVILATYNRKALLPRAVNSILGQTFKDFELLVIDNGSTDGTEAVVRGTSDGRVAYIRNPSPTTSCDAPRNLGIKMARGSYVSFLDDDDIWYPEKLEKTKMAFDKEPDVSCVCHYENRTKDGRMEGVSEYGPWTDDFYERLLYEGNLLSPSATTIRTDVLRQFGGFEEREEYREVADYDLWLRMAAGRQKIHFIAEPLGEFVNTGCNWSTKNVNFNRKVADLIRAHLSRYENKPFAHISKRGMWRLFKLYAVAGRSYARAGKYSGASNCFFKAAFFMIRRPSLMANLCSEAASKVFSGTSGKEQ